MKYSITLCDMKGYLNFAFEERKVCLVLHRIWFISRSACSKNVEMNQLYSSHLIVTFKIKNSNYPPKFQHTLLFTG